MEIEAAEMSRDVHDFADEIQLRHSFGFKTGGGKRPCIDAASSDFSGAHALGPVRRTAPTVHSFDQPFAVLVAELGHAVVEPKVVTWALS